MIPLQPLKSRGRYRGPTAPGFAICLRQCAAYFITLTAQSAKAPRTSRRIRAFLSAP